MCFLRDGLGGGGGRKWTGRRWYGRELQTARQSGGEGAAKANIAEGKFHCPSCPGADGRAYLWLGSWLGLSAVHLQNVRSAAVGRMLLFARTKDRHPPQKSAIPCPSTTLVQAPTCFPAPPPLAPLPHSEQRHPPVRAAGAAANHHHLHLTAHPSRHSSLRGMHPMSRGGGCKLHNLHFFCVLWIFFAFFALLGHFLHFFLHCVF